MRCTEKMYINLLKKKNYGMDKNLKITTIFQFEKMFDIVKEDWKLLNNRSQACILEEITKQGNKIGEVYRGKLLQLSFHIYVFYINFTYRICFYIPFLSISILYFIMKYC